MLYDAAGRQIRSFTVGFAGAAGTRWIDSGSIVDREELPCGPAAQLVGQVVEPVQDFGEAVEDGQ